MVGNILSGELFPKLSNIFHLWDFKQEVGDHKSRNSISLCDHKRNLLVLQKHHSDNTWSATERSGSRANGKNIKMHSGSVHVLHMNTAAT